MLTEPDIAWFAGFFEGEGSIRLSSHNNRNGRVYATPCIDICQVNVIPLEKARDIFPDSKIYGPYQYTSNRQPHFKWMVQGREKVEKIYKLIAPYLSERRVNQFQNTFLEHDSLVNRPKLKTGPKSKGVQ